MCAGLVLDAVLGCGGVARVEVVVPAAQRADAEKTVEDGVVAAAFGGLGGVAADMLWRGVSI